MARKKEEEFLKTSNVLAPMVATEDAKKPGKLSVQFLSQGAFILSFLFSSRLDRMRIWCCDLFIGATSQVDQEPERKRELVTILSGIGTTVRELRREPEPATAAARPRVARPAYLSESWRTLDVT